MNPILERIAAGRSADGWALYQGLAEPSSEDKRFGGVCLLNLRQPQQARDLLLQSRANGCEAAGIDLATVYRQLGHLHLSQEALEQVQSARLSSFDRALALRERGAQHYTNGELVSATEVLEQAWAVAHESPMCSTLLPPIGQALGLIYATRGLDRQAQEYLNLGLSIANPARAIYLRGARALCLSYMGELERADNDLKAAADGLGLAPLVAPYLKYVAGVLHRVRGQLESADRQFGEAITLAREAQEPETESYAELGRCAVATALGRMDHAEGHLARARDIAVNNKVRALALLREGALLTRRGHTRAIAVLKMALERFANLALLREQSWVWLHLAEAYLQTREDARAFTALKEATSLRHALGDGMPLIVELRLVPAVMEHLAGADENAYIKLLYRDVQRAARVGPLRVELHTLGKSELLLDGRRVRVDLRRTLEVLTYLLGHQDATLEQVLVDLFPDQNPARARNYFHQVRYELARAVPGLSVRFEPDAKTYRVQCDGLVLDYDVLRLRKALAIGGIEGLREALAHYRGPFLISAESEWARMEREDLASSVVRLGLGVIRDYYSQEEYEQCMKLAGRLLEIEPFDEALNEYLLVAVRETQGEVAARHMEAHIARRFERELGLVPPGLVQLRQVN